jgi:hypothetical protein
VPVEIEQVMHLYKNAPRHGALTKCKLVYLSKLQFSVFQEGVEGVFEVSEDI